MTINHLDFPRSFGLNPGEMNRHNSNKIYGNAKMSPNIKEVQIAMVNCPVTSKLFRLSSKVSAQNSLSIPTN